MAEPLIHIVIVDPNRVRASLTDRRSAHSVRFVTGHGRHGGLPADLDWRGLADQATTLVVYMAGRTAGLFSRRLILAGLPPDTPAVAAAGLGTPNERLVFDTLHGLEGLVVGLHSREAVIVGIGQAVADACGTTRSGLYTSSGRKFGAGAMRAAGLG